MWTGPLLWVCELVCREFEGQWGIFDMSAAAAGVVRHKWDHVTVCNEPQSSQWHPTSLPTHQPRRKLQVALKNLNCFVGISALLYLIVVLLFYWQFVFFFIPLWISWLSYSASCGLLSVGSIESVGIRCKHRATGCGLCWRTQTSVTWRHQQGMGRNDHARSLWTVRTHFCHCLALLWV